MSVTLEGEGQETMGEEAENHGLRARQEKFCQEYLKDFNATQAALRSAYSEDSARQIGSENLSKPSIASRIAELQAEQLAAAKVTPERIIQELARIAFVNSSDVVEWAPGKKGVRLKPSKDLSPDTLAAVAEVVQVKGNNPRMSVKLHDKTKALELLGRTQKLFTDQVQHSGMLGVQVVDDVPDGK